ncbi:PREDICTED: probable LRR receptor-like serine/threonine-protein kinase At1g56140 [Ipomoea nil]|uniref:probable LRR receptor-like serine/threonine-protein kinase At1g56140 n=1 Tax=Ipomoea nil TaxID=35883 RepID=UPI0009014BBC|nr:PREDICTED: probable LRR receptor-like serine/threonine-protein kinase At1g56140 [Ipomoea nil]
MKLFYPNSSWQFNSRELHANATWVPINARDEENNSGPTYGEKREGVLKFQRKINEFVIIHRDIKYSNILLDDDFQPKITDFGLARLLPENQSHLSTKFAGTLGYTAPEYAIRGHLLEKVDTYSFGVVVLEIVSGRRSSDIQLKPVTKYLLEQAWKLYENGEHLELVDESLDPNEYKPEEVKRILEIALKCTQSPSNLRPSMSEVVVMLSSDGSIMQRPPNRPTIIDFEKRVPVDTSTTTASSTSNATATFSEFTGR